MTYLPSSVLSQKIRLLGGNVSYRDVAKISWLHDEMVCTDLARERLVAWGKAGGLAQPEPSADDIRRGECQQI